MAGDRALLSQGTVQPTHSWAGAGDSRGSDTAQWEGSSLALSGFHCRSWLLARLTLLLGKGPCSLPQALHSGPPLPTRESRHSRTSCLAPSPPPGLRSVWSPSGGRAQPPHQWRLLWASPPPGQVRGPGGVCLVTGLDPDHKARDPPGISEEMLLAKPLELQGPDRKSPSLPCGFPAPAKTDPRAGVWDSPARGLLPDDMVHPGS